MKTPSYTHKGYSIYKPMNRTGKRLIEANYWIAVRITANSYPDQIRKQFTSADEAKNFIDAIDPELIKARAKAAGLPTEDTRQLFLF